MKDIIPAKKQSPILGLAGMGGGVGSNIVAGLAADPTYVDDVFSTYLYKGTGSDQSFNNGIKFKSPDAILKNFTYFAIFLTNRGSNGVTQKSIFNFWEYL